MLFFYATTIFCQANSPHDILKRSFQEKYKEFKQTHPSFPDTIPDDSLEVEISNEDWSVITYVDHQQRGKVNRLSASGNSSSYNIENIVIEEREVRFGIMPLCDVL